MNTAHRIEIKANNRQRTYFARASGTARFSYNWALAEWKKEYEAGGKPSEAALRRRLNSIKNAEFPWMMDVTKNAPQEAIRQLGGAFKRFFKGPRSERRDSRVSLVPGTVPWRLVTRGNLPASDMFLTRCTWNLKSVFSAKSNT